MEFMVYSKEGENGFNKNRVNCLRSKKNDKSNKKGLPKKKIKTVKRAKETIFLLRAKESLNILLWCNHQKSWYTNHLPYLVSALTLLKLLLYFFQRI